jgi:hypothetical protein
MEMRKFKEWIEDRAKSPAGIWLILIVGVIEIGVLIWVAW